LAAGGTVDVTVDSIAADSLGARRVSDLAYQLAQRPKVISTLVTDEGITGARKELWDRYRIVVEHGAAAALAAVLEGSYAPARDERIVVVLCGANTDPSDLAASGTV
jgi:threonine dehydratase